MLDALNYDNAIDAPPVQSGKFWPFIRSLARILAMLNTVFFLLRLWLPGPVVTIIQAVIRFIAELAAAHPVQSTAMLVSTVVATHAVALKTAPPEKWVRPQQLSL